MPRILAREVLVDGAGGTFAVGHRIDQVARAEGDVASGVDPGGRRRQRDRIDPDRPRRRDRDAVCVGEKGQVRLLADRQNARVRLQQIDDRVVVDRRKAAGLVEDRSDAPQFDPPEPIGAEKLFRPAPRDEAHAFTFRFFELLVALRGPQHRHLGEILERHDGDFSGAAANRRARRVERFLDAGVRFGTVGRRLRVETGAQSGPRGVERHEPAANDHDLAAEIHPEAAVDVEQVIHGLDDAVELDARYLEIASTRDADREEHRLEALRAKLGEAEGRGQRAVEPQVDAERDNAIDLGARGALAAGGTRECRSASCRRARPQPRRS